MRLAPALSSTTVPGTVRLHVSGGRATVTLGRSAQRNALDRQAWSELSAACTALAARSDVRVVMLCGEGEHFCAGADIHELRSHMQDARWMQASQAVTAAALDAWAALPQPTIAVLRGACYGGGAALAIAADFRLASDDARLAITPARLGLTYRLSDCRRVVQLVGPQHAREMLLLAAEVQAEQALAWGLVNEVVAAPALAGAVEARLSALLALSGYSQRAIKANLQKIAAGAIDDDATSRQVFAEAFDQPDFREAAAAFAEKRIPRFS